MEHLSGPALLRRWAVNQSGATAIEYALIASLISIVIISAVALIGGAVRDLFNSVATVL